MNHPTLLAAREIEAEFLGFLGRDIERGNVVPIGAESVASLWELTAGTEVDRDNDRIESDVGL